LYSWILLQPAASDHSCAGGDLPKYCCTETKRYVDKVDEQILRIDSQIAQMTVVREQLTVLREKVYRLRNMVEQRGSLAVSLGEKELAHVEIVQLQAIFEVADKKYMDKASSSGTVKQMGRAIE
jgi:hypothetical protein